MRNTQSSGASSRVLRAGAVVLASIPLWFGVLRAANTGTDFRYLWMALASLLVALAVMAAGRARHRSSRTVVALWALAVFIATIVGAACAFLLGATSAPAVWFVALGFALCIATGCALGAIAWRR